MINLLKFKKEKSNSIYSPMDGNCIDITEVKDVGFSSKTMGDGIAIVPTKGQLYAPANGTVSMLFRTKHAIGLETESGVELLIHIGIDTVNLDGKGFRTRVSPGDKVKQGDLLIEFDLKEMAEDYDMSTMLIVTNNIPINKFNIGQEVSTKDMIIARG